MSGRRRQTRRLVSTRVDGGRATFGAFWRRLSLLRHNGEYEAFRTALECFDTRADEVIRQARRSNLSRPRPATPE